MLPFEPTAARPGTEAKIEVMRQRVLADQPIFHPDDATLDPEEPFAWKPTVIRANERRIKSRTSEVTTRVLAAVLVDERSLAPV